MLQLLPKIVWKCSFGCQACSLLFARAYVLIRDTKFERPWFPVAANCSSEMTIQNSLFAVTLASLTQYRNFLDRVQVSPQADNLHGCSKLGDPYIVSPIRIRGVCSRKRPFSTLSALTAIGDNALSYVKTAVISSGFASFQQSTCRAAFIGATQWAEFDFL